MADEFEMPEQEQAPVNPIQRYLDTHKRVLDSIPRLQDEAIETGDYTKVDEANSALDRLNKLGENIKIKYNIADPTPGLLGPQGAPGQEGIPGTPPVPPGVINPMGLPQETPKLMQPTQQSQAPVVVNVGGQPQQPPAQTPTLLQPSRSSFARKAARDEQQLTGVNPELPPPPMDNKAKAKAAMGTIKNAESAVYDFINKRGEGYENINPHEAEDEQLIGWMRSGDWDKIASYMRVKAQPTQGEQPGMLRKAWGELSGEPAQPYTFPGDQNAKDLADTLNDAVKANDFLNEQRKPGGVLGLTREEVMPRQPTLLREKTDLDNQLKKASEYETPQLLARKKEVEANLENIKAFDVANPLLPSGPETPVGLLEGEPGEAEAKAGTAVPSLLSEPAPAPAPAPTADLELQREYNPEQEAPPKPAEQKKMVDEAKKIVKEHAPDYLEEFNKRVMNELGPEPKPNFLTIIGTILGGLAGNSTALKIWTDKVNNYNAAKYKIGSEIYSMGKQQKMIESQEKRTTEREKASDERQTARDEASFKRQEARDEASAKRLEKTLGSRETMARARLEFDQKRQAVQEEVQRGNLALKPVLAEMDAVARMTASFIPEDQQAKAMATVLAKVPTGIGKGGGAAPSTASTDYQARANVLYAKAKDLSTSKPDVATKFAALDGELRQAMGSKNDAAIQDVLVRMQQLVGE